MLKHRYFRVVVCVVISLLLLSCSITRYVPEDKTLLNKNKIKTDVPEVTPDDLSNYLLQKPNSYWVGIARFKLAMYSASKDDMSKWRNRWLRKVGEPPVIYDQDMAEASRTSLQKAMKNKGYWNAVVDTVTQTRKRKTNVTYLVTANEPYVISDYQIWIPDSAAALLVKADSANMLKAGTAFDTEKLNTERERVTSILRRRGYYNFQKEWITFLADTNIGNHNVELKMGLQAQYLSDSARNVIFRRKSVDHVTIYCSSGRVTNFDVCDTVIRGEYYIIYDREEHAFRSKMLRDKISIRPGSLYNERAVQRTYENLMRLQSIKYASISFNELDDDLLECVMYLTQDKRHGYTVELEGTNSAGNLGIGANVDYVNKNIFHGAETFKVGVHGGYEAMGKVHDVHHSWYVGGKASLSIPSVWLPATRNFRRRSGGTTEFSLSYDFQQRPQYRRNIANLGMRFAWRQRRTNYAFDLVDLSYVYLPWVSDAFRQMYMKPSSTIRYSYEDHFIMRWGFGLTHTNRRSSNPLSSYYVLRCNVRTAGNLLYGMSRLFHKAPSEDGSYKLFNIRFSQYAKAEFDFVYNHQFNDRNSLVYHANIGAVVPYLNASIVPYEERFFSGGANSLRGWAVRSLGPGSYKNRLGYIDYMNQSGDVKLDFNIEARFKLFWKLHAALFVDAGNIWTIRDYDEQPGGKFMWNEFYKQIACSYGFGLRLDFSFFVLRLDAGIKLYDPSYDARRDRWRTSNLTWRDDVSMHFAVGYPF